MVALSLLQVCRLAGFSLLIVQDCDWQVNQAHNAHMACPSHPEAIPTPKFRKTAHLQNPEGNGAH